MFIGRTKHDVREDLVLSHVNVTDSNTQAQHLLELELDCRADLRKLVSKILGMRDGRRELSGYVQTIE